MSHIQRIAITGSSGYCGRSFIAHVRQVAPHARILGLDVIPPKSECPDDFQIVETREPRLVEVLREFAPDTVVHMAFVMNVTHNDALMRDININGSRNVFAAVAAVKPQRFLYYSSMTAYGAWPDNPVPLDETWPLRARSDFRYAADKAELEGDVLHFANNHPDMAVSWVRPALVLGQGVQNYLSRYLLDDNFIALPDGVDSPIHFVHEDDLARATLGDSGAPRPRPVQRVSTQLEDVVRSRPTPQHACGEDTALADHGPGQDLVDAASASPHLVDGLPAGADELHPLPVGGYSKTTDRRIRLPLPTLQHRNIQTGLGGQPGDERGTIGSQWSQRLSENSEWPQLICGLYFGCHGHGFAWPCLRDGQSTATQSCDRGTLKTSGFFSDSLSMRHAQFRSGLRLILPPAG